MRRMFALAVVLLHVLFLALLLLGGRPDRLQDVALPVFVTQWIEEPTPPRPEPLQKTPPPVTRTSPAARSNPVLIEVPAAVEIAPPQSTTIPAPQVDWAREGKLAARRAGEQAEHVPAVTFSPPPKTVPKPCVPKQSSMEWNGQEDRKVTWAGPIPVVKVGKRCVWALVFVACNLSEIPEANSHLLDDMRAADRPRSSVPDPNICD